MEKCKRCGRMVSVVDRHGHCERCHNKLFIARMKEMAGDTSPDVGVHYERSGLFSKPVCRLCGAKKPLKEIDQRTGYCSECTEKLKAAYKEQQAAALEAEKKKGAEEAAKIQSEKAEKRQEAIANRIKLQAETYNKLLDVIPCAAITTEGKKNPTRMISEISDLRYNNITTKTLLSYLSDYVVVDVETTGIRASSEIVEISALRFEDFSPAERWNTLIKPRSAIPAEASSVNGITDEMVADAPTVWEVMPSFQAFVWKLPMVGHNLPFDIGFLYKYGFEVDPKQKRFDTLKLIKKATGPDDLDSLKLEDCLDYYGIVNVMPHRALSDCLATGQLFAKIVEDLTGE